MKAEEQLVAHSQRIPLECGEPVFAEPWEAQAFAMTLRLHEAGLFTWPEWAQALGGEIAAAGLHSDHVDYYRHWLDALEKLCCHKALLSTEALSLRQDEWRDAAAATPHGQPIVLESKR
ncbi:MAG TPA: nitrile hydratase accessory protein [Rhizobiaceae bacterium]|nr:nitrile hydratase accessory protein [Rhizobiaceae bacterium]